MHPSPPHLCQDVPLPLSTADLLRPCPERCGHTPVGPSCFCLRKQPPHPLRLLPQPQPLVYCRTQLPVQHPLCCALKQQPVVAPLSNKRLQALERSTQCSMHPSPPHLCQDVPLPLSTADLLGPCPERCGHTPVGPSCFCLRKQPPHPLRLLPQPQPLVHCRTQLPVQHPLCCALKQQPVVAPLSNKRLQALERSTQCSMHPSPPHLCKDVPLPLSTADLLGPCPERCGHTPVGPSCFCLRKQPPHPLRLLPQPQPLVHCRTQLPVQHPLCCALKQQPVAAPLSNKRLQALERSTQCSVHPSPPHLCKDVPLPLSTTDLLGPCPERCGHTPVGPSCFCLRKQPPHPLRLLPQPQPLVHCRTQLPVQHPLCCALKQQPVAAPLSNKRLQALERSTQCSMHPSPPNLCKDVPLPLSTTGLLRPCPERCGHASPETPGQHQSAHSVECAFKLL